MAQPIRIVFLSVIIGIFIFGIYDYTSISESNLCEMTYMYQVPEYLKVALEDDVARSFPHYDLYLYGEGKYATDSRNFRLRGIPVLFIPGNAGSYKQVRSLGSVALRKAMDLKTAFHFNYFSLDLNDELSGLFGGVLMDQTEFAWACIQHILTLYKGAPNPPKSVLVVGHSMGGLVARGLHSLPGFDANKVHTIITQATPHQTPVVAMDSYLADYYTQVNGYWAAHHNTSLKDVTVVSTGGGHKDTMVRSELASLAGIVDEDRAVSSNTMSVPRAFTSTDHRCHIWCKQIVLATTRAIFDIVDKNTKQIAVNPSYRRGAFQHHLVDTPGPRQYKGAYTKSVTLDSKVKWSVRKQNTWSYSKQETNETKYSVITLPAQAEMYGYAAVTDIDTTEWLLKCSVPAKKPKSSPSSEARCHKAENLAASATMLPPFNKDRKILAISGEQLSGSTHLVAVVPKSKKQQDIHGDLFIQSQRYIEYNVTDLLTFISSFPTSLMELDLVIPRTATGALFYNITLRGLAIPLQAYEAYVTSTSCNKDFRHASVLRFHVPWAVEDSYTIFKPDLSGRIELKLQNGRPGDSEAWPELLIYPAPECTYRVSIGIAWTSLAGQFVRFYAAYLPVFMVIQVLMSLAWQLKNLDEKRLVPSLIASHNHYAQPWRVVPAALIVRFMLYFPEDMPLASRLYLPVDDSAALQRAGTWYPAIPIMLYLIAYSIFGLYTYFFTFIISVLSRVFTVLFKRCCVSPSVVHAAVFLQYALLGACIPVAYYMCGTLAILVTYAIFFFKVFWSFSMARLSGSKEEAIWNRHNISVVLLILLMLTIMLNGPALVVWLSNFINRSELTLNSDPSRSVGMTVAICALLLTYANFPRISNELFGASSSLIYFSCVLMVVYCLTSIYRISYFICTSLLLVAVPAAILKFTYVEPPEGAVIPQGDEDLSSEEEEEIIPEPTRPPMTYGDREGGKSHDLSDEAEEGDPTGSDGDNVPANGKRNLRKRPKKT